MKFLIFVVAILFLSCSNEEMLNSSRGKDLRKIVEMAYVQGQVHAMKGDWAIEKKYNGTYTWKKNIWEGMKDDKGNLLNLIPVYDPQFDKEIDKDN